ncbi:TetR/AcrR family transcriptional regulator [Plantactinospora sp. S1510]|uniref:TetR/AcrR family transcriptional regulator n=1 Tax=Plantactinospora alkalitolerans TaxID=2789879 RepID=A0ABS0GT48_9ACTN|nr:TetR/AcrR family transcriptional regulator [Plantactinospora alkalitolerans]MBF9129371.1 TetR/AcrR family transcriptional regulator [Plantactinospora alkalitolerans]
MEAAQSPPPPRGGRPRDPQIDRAVLDATLAVLDEVGYVHLAFEEVARRAGTTKPAIYRRWPGRPRLVLAALAVRLGAARTPDTGCTLCDLHEGLTLFVALFDRIQPEVLGPLLADCAPEPDLRQRFMTTLFDPPRAAVARMIDRATARGDLRTDLDRDLVLDMLGSLVHYRALFGHAATGDADIDRAVEALLRGVATDYPALVEHSRRMTGTAQAHDAH